MQSPIASPLARTNTTRARPPSYQETETTSPVVTHHAHTDLTQNAFRCHRHRCPRRRLRRRRTGPSCVPRHLQHRAAGELQGRAGPECSDEVCVRGPGVHQQLDRVPGGYVREQGRLRDGAARRGARVRAAGRLARAVRDVEGPRRHADGLGRGAQLDRYHGQRCTPCHPRRGAPRCHRADVRAINGMLHAMSHAHSAWHASSAGSFLSELSIRMRVLGFVLCPWSSCLTMLMSLINVPYL